VSLHKYVLLLFILTTNGFLSSGSGTTKLHKNNKGHTSHNEYNANTITTTTNTIVNKKISILYTKQ
jgi:hypothetical protein